MSAIDCKIDKLQNVMGHAEDIAEYPKWTIQFGGWEDCESWVMDGKDETWNEVVDRCREILEKIESDGIKYFNEDEDIDFIKLIKEVNECNYDDVFTLYDKEEEDVYKIDWTERDPKRLIHLNTTTLKWIEDDDDYIEGTGEFEGHYILNKKAEKKPLDKSLYEEEPVGQTFVSNGNIVNMFHRYFDTKTLMTLTENVDECQEMYIYKGSKDFDYDKRSTWIDMIFSFEELDGVFEINYNGSSMFALWNCGNEYEYFNEEDEDCCSIGEMDDNKKKDNTEDLLEALREAEKKMTITINVCKKKYERLIEKKNKTITK